MADAATDQLIELPVTVHRSQHVTSVEGRKALITETTRRVTSSGQLPPTFAETSVTFGVDTRTGTYVADKHRFMVADEIRTGRLTFPPGVSPAASYPLWVEELMQPVPATYDRTAVIDGLELLVYVIDVANASVWRDSHSKGPESGDARIAYAVEPLTGTVVDERSHIVRRSPDPFGGWKTTFTSDLALTPETVSSNLETARSLRRRLLVTGTWVPWSLVGLGALLSSAGAVAYGLRWAASRAGGASPHRGPAPSRKA